MDPSVNHGVHIIAIDENLEKPSCQSFGPGCSEPEEQKLESGRPECIVMSEVGMKMLS